MKLRLPSPGWVTSEFGMRIHPVTGREQPHEGIDFSWMRPDGVQDWNVYAAASGTVLAAGPTGGGYGTLIRILHSTGVETRYAHLSRVTVRPGQNVEAGQVIGVIGDTGTAKGHHLHFELLLNGRKVNPAPYFAGTAGDDVTPIELKGTTTMRVIRNRTTGEFARVGEHSVLMLSERNAKIEATIWNVDKKPFDVSDAGFRQLVQDAESEGQRFAKQIAALIPGSAPGGFEFTGRATPA